MTRAFRCDRCWAFSVGDPLLKVSTKPTEPPVQERHHELCITCTAEMHDFLAPPSNDAPMTDRQERPS